MTCLTKEELAELEAVYASRKRDESAPEPVQRRSRQIRLLMDAVQMWRESAGRETE